MSAFECNVTPTRVRNAKKRSEDREPTIVDLRPFTGRAIVTFEDVPVSKVARRVITVLNPFPEILKISIVKKPKSEFNLAFEWLANEIPADSQINMELVWNPLKVVTVRETLEIADQFGNKKSIAIVLKSCELKKVAPRKTGLATKPLRLKAPSPPNTFVRQIVKKSYVREEYAAENVQIDYSHAVSPVKRAHSSMMVASGKSPLRNATNLQSYYEEDKPEVNVTPKNASALFSNIKFTPLTETKPKGESKLDYLSSLPTPVTVKRDDIVLSNRKTEISVQQEKVLAARGIEYSPEIESLKTPMITTRQTFETIQVIDQLITETPSRRPSTKHAGTFAAKILEDVEECDDDVFAATYVKGPVEIDEIDIVLTTDDVVLGQTHVIPSNTTPTSTKGSTFKVNKSKSFIESINNDFECQHTRAFSESMRVENENDKILLAIQGSMPNLCDIEEAMPIEQNRYYLRPTAGTQHVQNLSMESTVSNADFRELEFCAASSRLNLHEVGRSPKTSSPILPESPLKEQLPIRNAKDVKIQSPVIKRVRAESPIEKKVFTFSPPRNKLSDDVRDVYRRETFTVKNKQPKSPYVFAIPRVPRDMRGSSTHISQSLTSLSSSITSIASTSSVPATNGKLYNENIINSYSKKDPFSATTTEDPFLTSSMYLDERTLDGIEKSFMKWLNALVTIPPDLETKRDEKIDVAKLFNDVQNKDLTLAPTKEIVCSQYYTSRLDSLRSAAVKFFHSEEISKTLNKLAVIINEKKLLEVHSARTIHLDLVLQRSLLELLLCFNPLWLRIGLEVVFNVQLNLHSNQDIFGMSKFIITHMFKSQYLQQKYSRYNQQEELLDKLRKHTAKNFLFVLFFLDRAKENKLIKQNPCLFMKTAPYKDSNEILKKFASLVLANYGDIIRMMKRLNFVVTHKQTVIDEFDFAFKNLAVDLRDGVRLTKVMEVILLRDDLVKKVRVPAISRLQKVHNVELALKALEHAEYKIMGNINAKDIADGHREKTLSLLWQIIYKFRSPRFNAAASIIQKFWRSKWLKIVIDRRIRLKEEEKQNNAAIIIQKLFRGWKSRRETKVYREQVEKSIVTFQRFTRGFLARKKFQKMKSAAVCIQRWYRRVRVVRKIQQDYQHTRKSVIKIQTWWRRQLLCKKLVATASLIREIRNEENQAAIKIQRYFRGYLQMKKDRESFLHTRNVIVKVQQRFRAKLLMKSIQKDYQLKRSSACKIQQIWRATVHMRIERAHFLEQKTAAIKIQTHFRSFLLMKSKRQELLELRSAAIVIQKRFRALQIMKVQRNEFMSQKVAAVKIQNYWRGYQQMKKDRTQFLETRRLIVKIQQRYRGKLLMQKVRREYQEKRIAAIMIQQIWRAQLIMRVQRTEYHETVRKIVFVQQTYKAKLMMKNERKKYLELRSATITIQRHFRAQQAMLKARNDFLQLKQAVLNIETRYIALQLMKEQRDKFNKMKSSAIIIQRWYRNIKFGQNILDDYQRKKDSAIKIQQWWRRHLLARKFVSIANLIIQMREEKLNHQYECASKIQNYFRGYMQMKKDRQEFLAARTAIVKIQQRYRSKLLMRTIHREYQHTHTLIVAIQQQWRATLAMRAQRAEYLHTVEIIIYVQRKFRANQQMKSVRNEFLTQKDAAVKIQNHFRRYLVMKQIRLEFVELREATVKIQSYFRGYLQMKRDREAYENARSAIVKVQQRFRGKMLMKAVYHDYQLKRNSVIKIQKFWRGVLAMRQQKAHYQLTVQRIIFVQRKFRAKLAMRKALADFNKLKSAAIVIQRRFRARQSMLKVRNEFLKLKHTVLIIENRYMATKLANAESAKFLKYRETVIYVQRRFRMKLEARKLHKNFIQTRKSILGLQTHARGYLARRYFHEQLQTPENLENRRRHRAARAIQAAWRGHKERSKKSNFCFRAIVQRLIKVTKNVDPTQTLAAKLKVSIDFLKHRYDSSVAIATLAKLEYMSRTVPWILTDDAEFISAFCYGLMAQAIRSEIDKQIIELCSCIILNLGRYSGTKEDAFSESGLNTVANMLLRWCDKDCGIFNTLCTLIWVFSRCPKKKKVIRKFMMMRDGEFIMSQIKQNVARKENMRRNSRRPIGYQSISLIKYKKDYQLQLSHQPQTVYSSGYITPEMMKQCRQLPTLEPDYGVVRMHPYIFYSSVFAFETILKSLDINNVK